MHLTLTTFLIVCPLLFLAGFVDSIGGGGGLISLPAFVLAGLPMHLAIGTNKLAATMGTAVSTLRFAKHRMIDPKMVVPSVLAAVLGSSIGATISMRLDERLIRNLLLVVLPVAAFIVLNRQLFHDRGGEKLQHDLRTYVIVCLSAFVIGMYDGIYGPGTGTFLIIAFTVFAGLNITHANAQAKVINLTTNVTSLAVFLLGGQVLIPLGLAGAACNMLGNYLGSGLAMQNGARLVRPVILTVLALLLIRILTGG